MKYLLLVTMLLAAGCNNDTPTIGTCLFVKGAHVKIKLVLSNKVIAVEDFDGDVHIATINRDDSFRNYTISCIMYDKERK